MRDRLFFELAAGLIPALLLGGLLVAVKPGHAFARRSQRSRRWAAAGIAVLVAFFMVAEILAIELALGGDFGFVKVSVVVYAIVGATLLLGAGLVWPWLDAADVSPRVRALIPFLLVLGLSVGALSLTGTISRAESDASARCVEERVAPLTLEEMALNEQIFTNLVNEGKALFVEKGLAPRERESRLKELAARSEATFARSRFVSSMLNEAIRYCLA